MNKFYKVSSFLSLLFLSLLSSFSALGDGSRDLYPDGAIGYRAFLSANTNTFNMWPFPNPGIHYVYAQEGETITLASSAQGITNARIRLFAPNGTQVVDDGIQGKINNRTDEKNGPRLRGVIDGVGYTPIYYNVRETGIYRVEFLAHRSTAQSVTVLADSDWIQRTMDSGIAAWDVSVINTANSDFIKGRVYTNALNFSNGRFVDSTFNPQDDGFYGIVYVLTKAGYIYRVNNNGNNGVLFILFANNNGFVDAATQEPIYKSLNTIEGLGQRVHNPNSADTDKHITHKMFYTVPSFDLPTSGIGAVPGGYTWLKNAVITPDVSGVKLIGVDGSESQFSAKGGYIRFEAGEGQYSIKIESAETPNKFSQRILTGSSIAGENSIFWDGRAGDTTDTTQSGLPLPEGNIPLKVTVELKTAEIHFPFIDIDYNQFGIKVELLDPETLANTRSEIVKSDIVYWNDIDIPNVLNGSSSNPKNNSHLIGNGLSSGGHDGTTPNGHIWGVNGSGTSGLFGNNNAIDTWTFVKGKPGTLSTQLNVKEADLKVISITTNRSLVKVGEEIIFTVVVGNDGPSDVEKAPFAFNARMGFDITNVAYTSSCVKAEQEAVITDNVYKSKLDLDNGCEII